MPVNFTVHWADFTNDQNDTAGDVNTESVTGDVFFDPQFPPGSRVPAPEYLPQPSTFAPRRFTGYLDADGRLRTQRSGELGIRLWANDPLFNVPVFKYRVTANLTDRFGNKIPFEPFTFPAPSDDREIDLSDYVPVGYAQGVGWARGPRGFAIDGLELDGTELVGKVQGEEVGRADIADVIFDGVANADAVVDSAMQVAADTIADQVPPAVTAEIAGRDMLEGTDPRIPDIASDDDDVHFGLKDSEGRKQFAARTDGTIEIPLPTLAGSKLRAQDSPQGYLHGSKDSEGRVAEDAYLADGTKPLWVLDRWARRGDIVQKDNLGWNPSGGNRIVWMGDSITRAECYARITDPDFDSITLGGFVAHTQARVPSLRYAFNAGIGGNQTRQMRSRWAVDVEAYAPNVLHLLAGTNDVGTIITPAETIANLRWMIGRAKRLGCAVFLGTLPPRNDRDDLLPEIERRNVGIRHLAAAEGVHLIDYHSALVDPTNGHYKTGLTTDGIHPIAAGQRIMANAAAAVMNKVLVNGSIPVATSQLATSLNRIGNACFLTDTNADGIPDGWAISGTAAASTVSLVTDADFAGKAMRLDFTTASSRALTTSISTGFAVGDRIAFCGKFKAAVESGTGTFEIKVAFFGASGRYKMLCPINRYRSIDTDGVGWFYMEGLIPTGTTRLDVSLTAISGSGIVHLGQPALYILGNEGLPV